MVRFYPLGPSLQRDFARFIDDHGEEELQGFGCAECINKALLSGAPQSLADTLTDDDGSGLRDFSDLLVLLHDALDSRLKEKGKRKSIRIAIVRHRGRSRARQRRGMLATYDRKLGGFVLVLHCGRRGCGERG